MFGMLECTSGGILICLEADMLELGVLIFYKLKNKSCNSEKNENRKLAFCFCFCYLKLKSRADMLLFKQRRKIVCVSRKWM